MTESTIVKTKVGGTLEIAALGGGCYSTTTGALIAGAKSYTVAFEAGDVAITLPSRAINNFKDRGRTTSPPSIAYGDDAEGTIAFSCYLRDLSDAAAATISDILASLAGNPSGYVGTDWDSTRDSAAAANDAEVFTVGMKLTIVNPGNAADTHSIAFNYVGGGGSLAEGDPTTFSFSGTIYDPVDAYYIG